MSFGADDDNPDKTDTTDIDAGGLQKPHEMQMDRSRYIVLFLFLLCTSTSGFQWIQYTVIMTEMVQFYNESLSSISGDNAIQATSLVYMITYLPLIFPATFMLSRYGLRVCMITMASLNFLGCFIKCFSVAPARFAVMMTGQTFAAIAQIFTLGNPSFLAATWFREEHISTVSSLGVFGNQVGIAIGFLVPSQMIGGLTDPGSIARALGYITYPLTGVTGIILVAVAVFFKNKPKQPPNRAKQEILTNLSLGSTSKVWLNNMKRLVYSLNFVILFLCYGTVTGAFYAISINVDYFYKEYHPVDRKATGHVGLIIVLSGLLGSVLAGVALDRTRRYREITVGICALSTLSIIAYSFVVRVSLYGSYAMAFILGFFMTGFLPVGFEVAAEITYPVSEGISSGMLNVSAQIFGLILTKLQTVILHSHKTLPSNLFLCAVMGGSTVLAILIRYDLKRTAVSKGASTKQRPSDTPVLN